MTERTARITDVESIGITTIEGESVEIVTGEGRVTLLPAVAGERLDLVALVADAFYGAEGGPRDGIQEVEIRFTGESPIVVHRDLVSGDATVRAGGRVVDLGDTTPGERLLGRTRAELVRSMHVDGRRNLTDAAERGVAGALVRDVAEAAGIDVVDDANGRIGALSERIDRLRAELESIPPATDLEFEAVDPPALGDLIGALEQTREVELRLLRRRLDLAEALKRISTTKSSEKGATPPALLDSLERSATELGEIDEEVARLAAAAGRGSAYGIVTVTSIVLVAVSGLALMGKELGDDTLFRGGAAAAALTLLCGLGAGLLRARAMMSATRRVQALRARREELRRKALNTCRRVGAPADIDDITTETLNRIADRARSRDVTREIRRVLEPFIDTPAELETVRALAAAMDRPLAEAGDTRGPAAPILRASAGVVALARQWIESVDETARRIEEAGRRRIARDTEREMLAQSLTCLENERATLLRRRETQAALAGSCRRLALRLDAEVVPILRSILGAEAPTGFDAGLSPIVGGPGDCARDAAILTVTRLVLADGLGGLRVATDLTCGLDDAVSSRLLEWCLTAARAGCIVIAPRRGAEERALRQHVRELEVAVADVIEDRAVNAPAPEAGEPLDVPVPQTAS